MWNQISYFLKRLIHDINSKLSDIRNIISLYIQHKQYKPSTIGMFLRFVFRENSLLHVSNFEGVLTWSCHSVVIQRCLVLDNGKTVVHVLFLHLITSPSLLVAFSSPWNPHCQLQNKIAWTKPIYLPLTLNSTTSIISILLEHGDSWCSRMLLALLHLLK